MVFVCIVVRTEPVIEPVRLLDHWFNLLSKLTKNHLSLMNNWVVCLENPKYASQGRKLRRIDVGSETRVRERLKLLQISGCCISRFLTASLKPQRRNGVKQRRRGDAVKAQGRRDANEGDRF